MREALGLAPKRSKGVQGNRLDKHEFNELVKRGSTAEDLGAGHAEAARVSGIGYKSDVRAWELPTLPNSLESQSVEKVNEAMPRAPAREDVDRSEDDSHKEKRRHEEKKHGKHERGEKRSSRDSDEKRKHRKDKERRRD